jgi:hypothetical protein
LSNNTRGTTSRSKWQAMNDSEFEEYPEQFSDESRAALQEAAAALRQGLQDHVEALLAMRLGSRDVQQVLSLNHELERLVDGYNERAFDHTGTYPLSLNTPDDDGLQQDADEFEEPVNGTPVAVVSRWDLVVTDTDALQQAGRLAHKRTYDESDEDAAVAVSGVGSAMYAVLHERGEPWYDLPGVEVVRGVRAFIRPDEPVEPLTDDDIDEPIIEPAGERLYGESWA